MLRSIAVVNPKGGSGKSTFAVNLAAIFGRRAPVVLIDCDPQETAAGWLPESDRVSVVAAPTISEMEEALEGIDLRRGFVILDLPPHDPTMTARAIRSADLVLVPVRPSPADLRAVGPTLEALASARARALVVLNQSRPNSNSARVARQSYRRFGLPVAKAEIAFRVIHAEAIAAGLSVTEYAPGSPAAAEFLQLAREVARALEG